MPILQFLPENAMKNTESAHPKLSMAAWGTFLMPLIVGCAPTSLQSLRLYNTVEPLPRPDHILVHDFAVVPEDVRPHSSFIYRLHHDQRKGTSPTKEQVQMGRAVANIVAENLVKEIRLLGLPADRSSDMQPVGKDTFSIEGQFVSIDAGNLAQRISIGFGGEDPKVRTLVQGYLGTADGRVLVEEFETNTERAKKPGAGVMVGTSSADGIEAFRDAVQADAHRTTVQLMKQLTEFFVVQGWIAQEMIP